MFVKHMALLIAKHGIVDSKLIATNGNAALMYNGQGMMLIG